MNALATQRGSWARHGSYLIAGALGVALLAGGLRRRAAPEPARRAAPAAAILASSTFEPPSTRGESSSVAVSTGVPRPGPAPAVPTQRSAPPAAPSRGEHPHPISPAHQRIFEENNRIAALDGALDRGDVAALRALNAQYRSAYPEDEQVLQQGYDLIADCLEQRTPEVVDEARRFWREKRSSRLRRYVRKHCLEGAPPE